MNDEFANSIISPELASPPPTGKTWRIIVNTSYRAGEDIFDEKEAPCVRRKRFVMGPYSSLLLKSL